MTNLSKEIGVEQVKSWAKYTWLRHGFSTRCGGVSTVYGGSSLNLGWTEEDDPDFVRENRKRFVESVIGGHEDDGAFTLVGMRQIHSAKICGVRELDGAREGKLATPEGKPVLEGDGLITDVPGVLLAIGTADCVPVIVVDTRKRVVAAFHAGWRGTISRIVESGIATLQQSYGSRTEDLIAAIGPSIGPCCYTVGDEVHEEFASKFSYADQLFREKGSLQSQRGEEAASLRLQDRRDKSNLDLWEANRRQLLYAGLPGAQITVLGACTACSRDSQGQRRYFSHRAEHGSTGRMLAAVGIRGESPQRNGACDR